nr:uncharacterized protein LOC127305832 isoform X3 [Lolium perenne]
MHGVEPHSLDVQLSIEKLDIVSMIKHDFVSNWSNLNNLSYEITFFKKKWRVIKSERLVRLPAPALFNLDSRKSWSVTEDELDAYIERCDHHAGNGGSLIFERDLEALAEFLERPHPEFFGGQVNDQPGGELQWVVVADLRGKLEPPMSERIQFSVRENNRVDGLARAMQEALARLCGQNVNKINGNRTIPNATFGNISEEDSEGDTRNAGEFSKNSLSREEVEEVVRLGDKLKEASAWKLLEVEGKEKIMKEKLSSTMETKSLKKLLEDRLVYMAKGIHGLLMENGIRGLVMKNKDGDGSEVSYANLISTVAVDLFDAWNLVRTFVSM